MTLTGGSANPNGARSAASSSTTRRISSAARVVAMAVAALSSASVSTGAVSTQSISFSVRVNTVTSPAWAFTVRSVIRPAATSNACSLASASDAGGLSRSMNHA